MVVMMALPWAVELAVQSVNARPPRAGAHNDGPFHSNVRVGRKVKIHIYHGAAGGEEGYICTARTPEQAAYIVAAINAYRRRGSSGS